ncbi:MAG: RagB/SusD family nutrient uptake outer membrane protein [Bacteroidales bacterium]|nr:RagB/SusD family nutrient uptake outer membrane protein [Bacteroidales bacterium]
MKKNIIFLSVLTLALSACNLTLVPEDEVSPDNYFKTESDFLLWSNQFYSNNLEGAGFGSTTDVFLSNGISAYVNGGRNPATQSWSFTSLRRINYMLEHLDQCNDKAVATKYEAVGRFFRAYFYFKLVRTYGDVPYYDKVLGSTDPDIYKARDDRGYVMDKVLEDFDFAIANLPSTWEAMNTRVTRWAALGYASRAALYEGTFRKYHGLKDAEKYLQAAADYGREFVNSAPFTLYNSGATPYRDLFVSDNAITSEVVLARHYDNQYGNFHSMGYNVNFSRVSLTRRFVNHYLMADGTRFTDKEGWETMGYMEETKNRDPRLAQTVLCPGYVQKGANAVTPCEFYSHTGYEPIKFVPAAAKCMSSSDDVDFILLRAPEVYLNFAEALAELGTLTQNDLDISVNKIRTRAGMPSLSLTAANSNPDPYMLECYPNVTRSANTGVILEIRRERTVELALEEPDRSWDMFRWAECKQCLQHYVPWYGVYIPGLGDYDTTGDGTANVTFYRTASGVKIKVGSKEQDVVLSEGDKGYIVAYYATDYGAMWDDSRDYLWPIPASQRTLNGNLTQNPGYVDGVN